MTPPLHPHLGGNRTMVTSARIARVLIVATGILALSVTAAQAMPQDKGYHTFYRPQVQTGGYAPGYHGFYRPQVAHSTTRVAAVYRGVYRPPTPNQAEAIGVSGSGTDWTAGLLGAGTATLVLALGFLAARRVRPQRVAQL
jgi:hypothetical protein